MREVREDKFGLAGQDIWARLEELGFVHNGDPHQKESLTEWEQKLKSWLIWGYWESEKERYQDLGILPKDKDEKP